MFRISVAKVDRNVAHVTMAIHVCFKCMFQIFHLYQMLQVFSSGYCICMHVASVFFKWFQAIYTFVARVSFGCFICLQ
jgi:hypothetical protein